MHLRLCLYADGCVRIGEGASFRGMEVVQVEIHGQVSYIYIHF